MKERGAGAGAWDIKHRNVVTSYLFGNSFLILCFKELLTNSFPCGHSEFLFYRARVMNTEWAALAVALFRCEWKCSCLNSISTVKRNNIQHNPEPRVTWCSGILQWEFHVSHVLVTVHLRATPIALIRFCPANRSSDVSYSHHFISDF